MTKLFQFLRFLQIAIKAYQLTQKDGVGYCASLKFGVPEITCLVAVGRDSWRVSNLAIQAYEAKH